MFGPEPNALQVLKILGLNLLNSDSIQTAFTNPYFVYLIFTLNICGVWIKCNGHSPWHLCMVQSCNSRYIIAARAFCAVQNFYPIQNNSGGR